MYLVVCDHQVYHLVPVFASSAAHSIIFRENLLEITDVNHCSETRHVLVRHIG